MLATRNRAYRRAVSEYGARDGLGVEHRDGRHGHLMDVVQTGIQGGGDAAADAGRAAADVVGEQADTAQLDLAQQARFGLFRGMGGGE